MSEQEAKETKDIELKSKKDGLPIKTFTFDMFATDPAIIMIAKRGSGISWISNNIMIEPTEFAINISNKNV